MYWNEFYIILLKSSITAEIWFLYLDVDTEGAVGLINPNSLDNKGSWRILMLRELGLKGQYRHSQQGMESVC